MGGNSSRRRKPNTPIPSYTPGSPGFNRPGIPPTTGIINPAVNPNQQRDLVQANQTIANLTNQINAMQRGASGAMPIPQAPYGGYMGPGGTPPPMNYGTPPLYPYGTPPYPYGTPAPMPYGTPPYSPPSPALPHFGGPNPYPYHSPPIIGAGGYRDSDFSAMANIAGLNPADVALLHREFMNLTRGGINKIDRVVFRQILRDVLLEANNEQVDRAIENMFVTIDRNRDGYIDFPEFIGAFKDVLKGHISDGPSYLHDDIYPDALSNQLRAAGVGSGIAARNVPLVQQAVPATQLVSTGGLSIVPLASTAVQQTPLICSPAATAVQQVPLVCSPATTVQISDAAAPLLTLDPSQSSYVIATPGQYLITQPTALQCVPLPTM
ncbi:unnamed protein product [Adineta ricciae]|uniref:EF-hand domain-containing protein n=1 Tax=Adineta ricciae TaxID=249248 RepID=A0A814MHL0_ADIRI|nr:unnamed protein product [Adineta ricciae]CAF1079074.1 unnamed protein product [Adineta ricciae]